MHPVLKLGSRWMIALCGLAAVGAQAQNIFIKPGDVVGTATAAGHEHWIAANSLQWGVGVGIGNGPDGVRQFSAPSLSDVTWTQNIDGSVPQLMKRMGSQSLIPSTRFDLVLGGDTAPYLSLQLDNAGVSSVSLVSSGGSASAAVSVAYEGFHLDFNPAGLGQAGPVVPTDYDLLTARGSGPVARNAGPGAGGAESSNIYLRLGSAGRTIAGGSTAAGYENWIGIDSTQMGLGAAATFDARGLRMGVPNISELTLSKAFDATVPVVLNNLLQGRSVGQAVIEYVRNTPRGQVTFMQLVLQDVMFSGLTFSTGGELPMVSESLNFTAFEQTVWDINPDGTRGEAQTVGFDLARLTPTDLTVEDINGFGAGNLVGALPQAIPEPQTWALMLAGMALLARMRRRRA